MKKIAVALTLFILLVFSSGCGYIKDIARDSAVAIYEKAKPDVEEKMLVLADRVADRMVAKGDEIKQAAEAARGDGELLKYLLLAVLGHVGVTGGAELRKLVRDRNGKKEV